MHLQFWNIWVGSIFFRPNYVQMYVAVSRIINIDGTYFTGTFSKTVIETNSVGKKKNKWLKILKLLRSIFIQAWNIWDNHYAIMAY